MSKLVLIIDDLHDSIVPQLEQLGFTVNYRPEIKRPELLRIIKDYSGLIVRSKTRIDEEVITAGNNLEFIGRSGAGMDLIDVDVAQSRGIKLVNSPEGNRDALGEHAIGMMLCLLNNIKQADSQVRQRVWKREENRGVNIMEKTVSIIGYGNMGSAFAQRLSGFGCRVLAYDKYKTGPFEFAREVRMEQVFRETDVLSLHLPLTEETRNLVDSTYISQFQSDIYLINTARGGILDERALVDQLKIGKITGAALDVLENENLSRLNDSQDSNLKELIDLPNVILTPHIAGWSHESYLKLNQVLIEKIKSLQIH